MMATAMKIIQIKLSLSNVYLVLCQRPMLIDAGSPNEASKIIAAVERAGVAPRELSLILLTHGHGDHAGSAKALREITGAAIALHTADVFMARQGHSGLLGSTRWTGRISKPFVDKPFDAFTPDIVLNDETSLASFGVAGRVICTPGHTAGSVSAFIGDKADEAIVGDVLMGGHLGGLVRPSQPRLHYFAEDLSAVYASLAQLIALAPRTLYVGHGGPLALADVVRLFGGRKKKGVVVS